jgi:4-hydroxyproline epimerase
MSEPAEQRFRFVDSHTGGEPTRLLLDGSALLGKGTMAELRERMRQHFDWLRSAAVNEPRASPITVGAMLCAPVATDAACGVIFFNNAGYLGMCGHGLIGLIHSLHWLGQLQPGRHSVETPVGVVEAELETSGAVSFRNVLARRAMSGVALTLPDGAVVHGDVAWGGNWFFLCEDHGLPLQRENIPALMQRSESIRLALQESGLRGDDGNEIDHIELTTGNRNFVLCPGYEYDRSPCGTGTSAKLACLAADGKLAPGAVWEQESIIGSRFTAAYQHGEGGVLPTIRGRASVTASGELVLRSDDEFRFGNV